VAGEIAEKYIFANADIRERVFLSVADYLQQYPDERVEGFLAFSRRPENQPRIDDTFSSGTGRTVSPRRSAALKSKKKMAEASKRKNRGRK